jgi:pSer/pThr/pTyr-binding forkhead associated (FHA) protein
MPTLLISLVDGTQVPVDLINEETFIGRLPENDIAIDEESLSGRHARFVLRDGVCELEDLQSTNGTFVNGTQIDSIQLTHGDQLQFGELTAGFQALEADAGVPAEVVDEQPISAPELSTTPGQSRRPASFASISPLKRVPANNNSSIPLVAAAVAGFVSVGAVVYTISTIPNQ